jgi:hypothetical protein
VIFNIDNAYASLVMNSDVFIKKMIVPMTIYIMSDIYIVYAYDKTTVIVQQYSLLEILSILSRVGAVLRDL